MDLEFDKLDFNRLLGFVIVHFELCRVDSWISSYSFNIVHLGFLFFLLRRAVLQAYDFVKGRLEEGRAEITTRKAADRAQIGRGLRSADVGE